MPNETARHLRKNLIPQEVKVWNHLRAWRSRGFDGGQHNFDNHAESDRLRDDKLMKAGFRVLRFWNSDIDQNPSGVLQTIGQALTVNSPHPAAFGGHPPPAGEG